MIDWLILIGCMGGFYLLIMLMTKKSRTVKKKCPHCGKEIF
jgi:hypothetical protein